MRLLRLFGLVCFLSVLTLAVGCSSDESTFSTDGAVKVYLTDAPIDMTGVSAVNVTFTGLTLYASDSEDSESEEGVELEMSSHVVLQGGTINLLEFQGGAVVLMGAVDVPAGEYKRIRLHVSAAELVRDDDGDPASEEITEPVKVPSSKIDVRARFTIDSGEEADIVLDFDAAESVHLNQTGGGKYILRPVINHIGTTIR